MCVKVDGDDIKRVDMATKIVSTIKSKGEYAYECSINVFKSPCYPNDIVCYGTKNTGLFLWDLVEDKLILKKETGGESATGYDPKRDVLYCGN